MSGHRKQSHVNSKPCHHCQGSGWLTDTLKKIAPIAKMGMRVAGGPLGSVAASAMDAIGMGGPRGYHGPEGCKCHKKRKLSAALARRNEITKRVALERGVSLMQASRIVKAEGLYQPQ